MPHQGSGSFVQSAYEAGSEGVRVGAPAAFARRFVTVFTAEEQRRFIDAADRNHLAPLFMERRRCTLGKRVVAAAPAEALKPGQPAPDARKGRIALFYTIGGMMNAVQSNGNMPPEELEDVLAHLPACALTDVPGQGGAVSGSQAELSR